MRLLIQFISNLLPKVVANYAYRQLTSPQVRKLRAAETVVINKAQKNTIQFKDFDIRTYKWAGSGKSVLLIHGWEGQAGNFSDLIERMIEEKYNIYAFDAPSHGFSSRGPTSLFEFTELVGILIKKYKVKNLISHSFGGVATTYALHNNLDIKIDKYILLTTPDKFLERINDVSENVGITPKVQNLLIKRLEKETNLDVSKLNVSDFVKLINVNESLIIHDKNDKVIPIERSMNVHKNWKNSSFEEVENTGHFRILRTEAVINRVLEYIN